MGNRLRLALFISGGGTTASAIIHACRSGKLSVDPVCVIASKPGISGIKRVIDAGINASIVKVVNPKRYDTEIKFTDALLRWCDKFGVNLIGQYGWLPLTPINLIREYKGRIINQHPGPLDTGRQDFGGKGMYGRRVHAAVLYLRRITNRDFWTQATTHFVTQEFDRGKVIKQRTVDIIASDTVEDLQRRVLPVEHRVQIDALKDFVNGKVKTIERVSPLVRNNELKILTDAKRIAAILYPNG